jgi:hypothetical protein
VRCATRDHLPMAGNVPDYDATLEAYQDLAENKETAVAHRFIRSCLCWVAGFAGCVLRRCWLKY